MCGSMVVIQSVTAENRRGKKKTDEETTAAEYNGRPYWVAIINTLWVSKTWQYIEFVIITLEKLDWF